MRERTGRKIKHESMILDKEIKEAVKRRLKRRTFVIKWILVDKKGYSISDYERFIKWLNDFPKGRRIPLGLLIDVLNDLGIDYKDVIDEALKYREEADRMNKRASGN